MVPRLAAIAVAGALLLSACASNTNASDNPALDGVAESTNLGFINLAETGEQTAGGTLTFGSYSFPNSLDPTVTLTAGSNGGTEMSAIYDALVRSDPEQQEFVPQLAESLTSNEDFTQFSIGLREGTRFSDGSTLDAAAVKWSIDRYVDARADVAQEWIDVVESVETPDPATVVFTLKHAWDNFPVLLTMGPGMIVSETAEAGGEFTPIGAGPFTLAKFAPQEEILMAANPNYVAGPPHLEKLRFVPTAGASGTYESLRSGQLDMGFIMRDESVIRDAQSAGYSGYLAMAGLGTMALINHRDGRPGADLRIRKAIALGVDPETIKQRANNGLGTASSEILPPTSPWYDGVEGLRFDPHAAKQYLEEAKADGFDGKLTYVTTTEPSAQEAALATQASLNAIGFNVTIDHASSTADLVRRLFVEHDFDVTRTAMPLIDEAPYMRLFSLFGSQSHSNSGGYSDPAMDKLLIDVQAADTLEAKTAALGAVQEHFNETVPAALWGPTKIFVLWDGDVHGVKRSTDNMILFDSVWIDEN